MEKQLVIVFVKNMQLGKVKTRLAKSIGDEQTFEVYKALVAITERETAKLEQCDVHIYFSDSISEDLWPGKSKFVQQGADLGARMKQAFAHSFSLGYQKVIGVGSDLPDLNAIIIAQGFSLLEQSDTVFGPAEDGGYYLIGMKKMHDCIFENKPWSTENLLDLTLQELTSLKISTALLPVLNDIDTIDDLRQSGLASQFIHFLA